MKALLAIILTSALSFLSAQDAVPVADTPPTADSTPPEATPTETPAEAPPAVEDEAVIPTTYDISRYQSTWEKNPFLLKTVAPSQPTANWAQDYALAGMFNNKGKIRISIRNKQTNEFKHISSDGKPDAEFHLVKANFNRNRSEASAVIAKGTEEAEVKYDDTSAPQTVTINNTMRSTTAPGAPGNPGGMPGVSTPGNPGGVNRPGQPQLNKPASNMPNGRVFNAPGLQGGVSSMPGNPATGMPMNGGNVINQPGINIGQPGVVPTVPGNTPPVISRRRQLIPAPVIPAQP